MRKRLSLIAAVLSIVPLVLASPAPAASFTNVRLPGTGQGEPSIAISPNGTIFVNAPRGTGTVWSGDGVSFTRRGFDDVSLTTSDTDLAVAPDDGRVYATNLATSFSNFIYTSTDNGATYSGPAIAGVDSDRQWITAWKNGVSYVAYHDLQAIGAQNIWIYRSTDGGATYLPHGNVAITTPVAYGESATLCGNITDRIHIDPSDPTGNTMFMTYGLGDVAGCAAFSPTAKDLPINQAWVAKSVDGGRTWASTEIAGDLVASGGSVMHLFPSLAIDNAGVVYVVYSKTGPGTQTHAMLQVSKDHGLTWSAPHRVDQGSNGSNVMATIAARDPGRIDVVFYTSSSNNFNGSGNSWVVADVRSTNASAPSPTFTQSQVSSGVVHIGDICTAGLNCVATFGNRNLLDFMGVAIDASGLANVVWANDRSGITTWFGRG